MDFHSIISLNGKLYIRDRLKKWKQIDDSICPLYIWPIKEFLELLFFSCSYSAIVWELLLSWQGYNRSDMALSNEIILNGATCRW